VAKTTDLYIKLFPNAAWQKLLKLANVSRSYWKNNSVTFLWTKVHWR